MRIKCTTRYLVKKVLVIYSLINLSIISLYAISYKSDAKFPLTSIVNPVTEATGGHHIGSYDSYFSLLSNPASLGLCGDKTLWPLISAKVSGPIEVLPDVVDKYSSLKSDDNSESRLEFLNHIERTVDENKGLPAFLSLTGPIAFGNIRNKLGWGLFCKTDAGTEISSLTNANAIAGETLTGVFGYGFPFEISEKVKISLGTDLKLVADVSACKNASVNELLNVTLEKMPMVINMGIAADIGFLLSVTDIFSLGFTWSDVSIAAMYNMYNNNSNSFDFVDFYDKGFWYYEKGKPGIGLSVNIPVTWTKGVLSSWKLFTDYYDFYNMIDYFANSSKDKKNPLLDLSGGIELIIFNTIALRCGMHDQNISYGAGLDLSKFHMNFAMYTDELGLNRGENPRQNVSISLGVYY